MNQPVMFYEAHFQSASDFLVSDIYRVSGRSTDDIESDKPFGHVKRATHWSYGRWILGQLTCNTKPSGTV